MKWAPSCRVSCPSLAGNNSKNSFRRQAFSLLACRSAEMICICAAGLRLSAVLRRRLPSVIPPGADGRLASEEVSRRRLRCGRTGSLCYSLFRDLFSENVAQAVYLRADCQLNATNFSARLFPRPRRGMPPVNPRHTNDHKTLAQPRLERIHP